jgi:hypothetical protein
LLALAALVVGQMRQRRMQAAMAASPVVVLEVAAHPSPAAPQAQAAQGAVALSS